MTNPPDPTDPFRSLDGHEPPAHWDDVVARAERPENLVLEDEADPAGRRSRRVLAAAAAVLVVLGLVAAVGAAIGRDDDGQSVQAANPAEDELDPVTDIWGHRWIVIAIESSDGLTLDDDPTGPAGPAVVDPGEIVLDATRRGLLEFEGCRLVGGPVRLDGDHVVRDGEWAQETCATKAMESIAGQPADHMAFLEEVLDDRPRIEISGDDLTLTATGGDQVRLRREAAEPAGNDPTKIFGRLWVVESRADAEHPDGLPLIAPIDDPQGPILLDTRQIVPDSDPPRGQVTVNGCNGAGGGMRLDRDRLVKVGIWAQTLIGCQGELPAQDAWFGAFLESGPKVEVRGDRATLGATGGRVVELHALGSEDGDPVLTTTTTTQPRSETTTTTEVPATTTEPEVTTTTRDPELPMDDIPEDPPPSAFFEHDWTITHVREGTEVIYQDIRMTTDPSGRVSIEGCKGLTWTFTIVEGRLVADPGWEWMTGARTCDDGTDDAEKAMRDDFLFEFFTQRPTFSLDFTWHGTLHVYEPGWLVSFERAD